MPKNQKESVSNLSSLSKMHTSCRLYDLYPSKTCMKGQNAWVEHITSPNLYIHKNPWFWHQKGTKRAYIQTAAINVFSIYDTPQAPRPQALWKNHWILGGLEYAGLVHLKCLKLAETQRRPTSVSFCSQRCLKVSLESQLVELYGIIGPFHGNVLSFYVHKLSASAFQTCFWYHLAKSLVQIFVWNHSFVVKGGPWRDQHIIYSHTHQTYCSISISSLVYIWYHYH